MRILFFLLLISGVYGADDVILKPLVGKTGAESSFIFLQGAEIPAERYVPLMRQIQEASPLKLWIGVPSFPGNMALDPSAGLERVLGSMEESGMKATKFFYGGHSLGGAMLPEWGAETNSTVDGQVLMGAFIERGFKDNYKFAYTVPTLTIGGELDGLARVTRIAEAYYTQLMDAYNEDNAGNRDLYPVTVLDGVSHMQFASGEPTRNVMRNDLIPEVSNERAHEMIAADAAAYLTTRAGKQSTSTAQFEEASAFLSKRLDATQAFMKPIFDAFLQEGYHNIRPPCLCSEDVCEPSADCFSGSSWSASVSQQVMSNGDGSLEGVTINVHDSFHDVWESDPGHFASVQNSCEEPAAGCTLEMITVTQGVYHTGEDLEIWEKHVDVPNMDTSAYPISARELRTKMTSRQKAHISVGDLDASFAELDGGGVRCGEINQQAIDWASQAAGEKTASRFAEYGQRYVIGPDKDVCPAGPCWIWSELAFEESEDGATVSVISPQFSTEADYIVPGVAGFHYCKVLSPLRAVEWMYVDGLRKFYSLLSTQKTMHLQ